MRSRLGERLSLERDSASLKTRVFRLSENSSVALACFCKSRLSDRLGESIGPRYYFFLPLIYFHTQTIMSIVPYIHSSIQAQ